jgi:hypothetical protein
VANVKNALAEALVEAVSGHRCVSGWLGRGNALFLGFGDSPLPPFAADGYRVKPPYQLETNFADWCVRREGRETGSAEDRTIAERAIQGLIGHAVKGWELGDDFGLRIDFGDGSQLQLTPWRDEDRRGTDAWLVCLPEGWIVAVSCGGQAVRVPRSLPIREWFAGR